MHHYYVNKNAPGTGEHEVHRNDCKFLPDTSDREYLGLFSDCREAINKAYEKYEDVNGCISCISGCHSTKE